MGILRFVLATDTKTTVFLYIQSVIPNCFMNKFNILTQQQMAIISSQNKINRSNELEITAHLKSVSICKVFLTMTHSKLDVIVCSSMATAHVTHGSTEAKQNQHDSENQYVRSSPARSSCGRKGSRSSTMFYSSSFTHDVNPIVFSSTTSFAR